MKKIRIAVAKKDLKKCVSLLQKAGVVETKKSEEIEGFSKKDFLSERLTFERMVSSAENALDVLDKRAPEEKGTFDFLNGRKEIDADVYKSEVEKSTATIKYCYDILALDKQYGEEQAEISRISMELDELEGWKALDVPTGFKGTRHTSCFIGSLPIETTVSGILESLAECGYDKTAEIEVISSSKIQTNIFVSCLKTDAEELEKALRKISFSFVSSPSETLVPLEKIKDLKIRQKGLEIDGENILQLINVYTMYREDIKFFIDYYTSRADRYELYGELLQSENVAIIDGFIPEKYSKKVTEEIEKRFAAAVELTDPSEDEEVPVALENKKFFRPCQSLVAMYSMPSKHDIDPTSTMAIFFYVFFGMMLSDAGYGLIIAIACAIGLCKFKLEDSWKHNLQLFLYCGISAIIWGIMFGGYFGNLIPAVSGAFFGKEVTIPPLWLDPLSEPLKLLVFGILFGIVHLFFGMGIKFYLLCKQGKVLDAIFDVGFWFITLVGAILMLANPVSEMMDMTIPVDLFNVGAVMAIAGAIGLVLTQGRDKKGFGKVISGIASLYDITSYASDMLSYSRLMALGLATGVLAMAINTLGTMLTGVIGAIVFVVIFLFGSALSLAMNALGAYVHTVRLQYVEYFSKFYEGGGKAFKPFLSRTKYYKLKK